MVSTDELCPFPHRTTDLLGDGKLFEPNRRAALWHVLLPKSVGPLLIGLGLTRESYASKDIDG